MKVKYNGKIPLRYNGIDFQPGETKEVAPDLKFTSKLFEVFGDTGSKKSNNKDKIKSKK